MKNKFQSKTYPQGSRTLWRYLSALIILFTFAIGNVWAGVTIFSSVSQETTDGSWTITGSSNSSSNQSNVVFPDPAAETGFPVGKVTASTAYYCKLSSSSDKGAKLGTAKRITIGGLSAGDSIVVYWFATSTTSGKLCLSYATGASAGAYIEEVSLGTIVTKQLYATSFKALTATDIDHIENGYSESAKLAYISSNGPSPYVYAVKIISGSVTKHTVTYKLNGATGTTPTQADVAEGAKFTLHNGTTGITAPTNKDFDGWHDGTTKYAGGAEYTMGTSDVELTAQWKDHVAKYTVIYKDGTTELGSETVEVGQHPTGSEIAAPTKDCYTFMAWDPALSGVSGSDGDEIEVNATWTPNYAFGAYSFVNVAEVGTAPNKLTMSDGNTVNVPAGSRVDNFYFSAMAIKYESGASTALTDYKGWKINTKDATIKFLVENNSQVKVAIGRDNTAAVSYTALNGTAMNNVNQEKSTEVAYSVKAGTMFTISMTTGSTITLKRIAISPLCTATYIDETGDASGSASNVTEVTLPTPTETTVGGYTFNGWTADQTVYDGTTPKTSGSTLTAGSTYKLTANTTFTAQWAVPCTPPDKPSSLVVKDGTLTNTSATLSWDPLGMGANGYVMALTSDPAGADGTFDWTTEAYHSNLYNATGLTPNTDYTFKVKYIGGTGECEFSEEAFVDFSTGPKVLYVTSTAEATVKANDKLYAALKDLYNVKIVGPTSDVDQSVYALIVLHESIGGGDYNKTAVATAKTGSVPVLNTKSYFYNSGRFGWGTPNAGQSVNGATLNSAAYCNIADHPLFDGVTVSAGFVEITDDAEAKCMQPVGSFTSGKEGYTLATTPNAESGDGCAIHELTPAQRGASAGKYLLISVSNAKLDALNANGQKLFQNAAAYLIGSTSWVPVNALTSPEITADPNAAYSVGDNIALTASATGTSATTTYTWYKGDTWAEAETAGAIQATATAAAGGNTYEKASCIAGDAGTYWCVISNGTGCEVSASLAVTVSDISYDITFVSAHGTAPSTTTGVSYTLPELSADGWAHQGWTASIDVEVDAASVTAGTLIANGKTAVFAANVEFTAVWKQKFQVTFNGNGHGDPIAAQIVVDGELATEPDAPFEIGYDFGGWFKEAACTNAWDFASDAVTEGTELFAKWTEFPGCTLLYPAKSGSALHVGDNVDLQSGSKGGIIAIVGMKTDGSSIAYNANGLQFSGGGADVISVTLNNDIAVDTKISVTLVAANTGARGLNLLNATGGSVAGGTMLGWNDAPSAGAVETFSYTVTASDGLDGTNIFRLQRNNSVYLKCLKVESCGSAIIYHDLTTAITPDHDPAYATVTLGATSVREGLTTTATYSAIDPAYEFDEWEISGTGASIEDASVNPAVITMGTEDAVITLKLKVATLKHTVSFNTHGGSAVASVEVEHNAYLAAAPAAPTKEDYIFQYWSLSDGGAEVDITTVQIDEDKTFHAVWAAETGVIKLLNGDGSINTTNFTTGVTASTVNFDDVDHNCASFGSTGGSIVGLTGLNKVVSYNATTTQTKVKFVLYNTNSSAKEMYLQKVLEGATVAVTETISVPSKELYETTYYAYNSSDLRSFYVTVNSTNIKILQMKVVDDGTALKRAGEAGYELNLNQGRVLGAQNVATTFEGLAFAPSSNAKVLNSTELPITTPLSFTIATPLTLTVTTTAAKYYVSQNSAEDGTTATAINDAGEEEFDLTVAGTWYIVPSTSSAVKLTNIAFALPKAEAPTITTQPATNHTFAPGDLTATVVAAEPTDGGTLSYQWYNADGDVEVVGATEATLTTTTEGTYYVIVTNSLAGHQDNSTKSDEAELGYRVTNDATLMALSYGTPATAITLEDGVYTYAVELAKGTTDVPALAATATMDGYATVTISNAAEFVSYAASSTVTVKSEDATVTNVYTVNFTVKHDLPQVDVTATTTWNWANAAETMQKILPETKDVEQLMANIDDEGKQLKNDAEFNSQALIFSGQEALEKSGSGANTRWFAKGGHIKFNVTVPGIVEVEFSDNGNNNRRIKINDAVSTVASASNTDVKTYKAYVQPGEVMLMGVKNDGTGVDQYIRISKIIFTANPTPDYTRNVTNNIGTLCVDHNVVVGGAMGATFYQIASRNEQYNDKIDFEEVLPNEELKAGEPYIFQSTTGRIDLFFGETVAVEPVAVRGMIGSFVDANVDIDESNKNDILYIANNKLWNCDNLVGSHLSVVANRAYIVMSDVPAYNASPSQGAPRRRVTLGKDAEQVATGCENLNAADKPVKMILNGQLFILRGEKMYDAKGQLVK